MPSVSPSSCSTLLAPTASPASSSWGGGGVLVLPRRAPYRPCRRAPPDDPEPDRFGGRPEAVPGPPPDRPTGPRSGIAAPAARPVTARGCCTANARILILEREDVAMGGPCLPRYSRCR